MELDDIENYKIDSTIIRSKIILNDEEKPNKYFFIQEKKRHIKSSQNQQGKILTTNSEILKECKNHFPKLIHKTKNMRNNSEFTSKTYIPQNSRQKKS